MKVRQLIAPADEVKVDTARILDSPAKYEEEKEMLEPRRYHLSDVRYDPAPLEEVRANMTLYLHNYTQNLFQWLVQPLMQRKSGRPTLT